MNKKKTTSILFILFISLLSACQGFNPFESAATSVPPTPTSLPQTTLTVCLGYEPESLYPYAVSSQAAQDVLQAIYDGPIDTFDGQAEAVILETVPNFADSSARFTAIDVQAGDPVVDIHGGATTLESGVQVYPSGCTDPSCAITWDGSSALRMDQPTIIYNLLPDLTWSDGEALTAADSVYSFELASDPDTPTDKTYIDQTDSYQAVDETTLEWVGLPGLVTEEFEHYFWMPLPQHAWGEYSAAELLEAEEVTHSPLGWGPYVMDEWAPGEYIRLKKNDLYFRADEGLPKYDYINFEFIQNGDLDQASDGTCDIVTSDVLDLEDVTGENMDLSDKGYDLIVKDSDEFEFLAFGITPASYDDGYYPYGADRPGIFNDVNTRRAIALCIDRQSILEELTGGLVDVSDSYVTDENSLLSGASLSQYTYDPDRAKTLLNEIGWQDYDLNPETPWTMAIANDSVPVGTSFSITLITSESAMRSSIAESIAEDLSECGIQVTVEQASIQDLYQPGSDGPIFGRDFDLALLSMNIGSEPHCELFTSDEIPSEENYWLGTATGGSNFMGYTSEVYNEACKSIQSAGLDTNAYISAVQNSLQILSEDLPFIPMYHHPEFILVKKDLCLLEDDVIKGNILQSIESMDPYADCT